MRRGQQGVGMLRSLMSLELLSLQECLPGALRSPGTTITKIGAGMSGAGVYRVDAAAQVYVLKVADAATPLTSWRGKLEILQLAANAGLAARIIHVDEARRALLSEHIADRSFAALFADPSTREAALVLLGRTLRRVHDLPLPSGSAPQEPREFLARLWSGLDGKLALPAFVGDVIRRLLDERAPPPGRALALSHNDVNPTNLAYDGERLVLLDWDTAGVNDPLYDLATVAMFLRMDEQTCQRLLAAHDDAPASALPARFRYSRRLVAALCGAMFLHLARQAGHPGATGSETIEATPSLGEFYQQLRAGSLSLAGGDGRWWGGLALVKESAGL
jgi:aminoglycoside phosphotransferase (APT) family kinase protein